MPQPRSPFTLAAALRRQAVLTGALGALAICVAVGVLLSASLAGQMLAAVLLVLAVLRAALPLKAVGALAVRSRGSDVAVLLVLSISLGVLSTAPNL